MSDKTAISTIVGNVEDTDRYEQYNTRKSKQSNKPQLKQHQSEEQFHLVNKDKNKGRDKKTAAIIVLGGMEEKDEQPILEYLRSHQRGATGFKKGEVRDINVDRYQNVFDRSKIRKKNPDHPGFLFSNNSHTHALHKSNAFASMHKILRDKNPYVLTITEGSDDRCAYGFPGGTLDTTDTITRNGCIREIYEETGLNLEEAIDPDQQRSLSNKFGLFDLPMVTHSAAQPGMQDRTVFCLIIQVIHIPVVVNGLRKVQLALYY